MTNPHSMSWRTIIIQNTMENGEGERDEISRFLKKKESTKNDCFIILIIALCQMTGHQLIKKNLHYWHTKNNLKLYSISK